MLIGSYRFCTGPARPDDSFKSSSLDSVHNVRVRPLTILNSQIFLLGNDVIEHNSGFRLESARSLKRYTCGTTIS